MLPLSTNIVQIVNFNSPINKKVQVPEKASPKNEQKEIQDLMEGKTGRWSQEEQLRFVKGSLPCYLLC